ncbi:uncharacterized protein METZ01_LOCUS157669, partial [marine metagenome]
RRGANRLRGPRGHRSLRRWVGLGCKCNHLV